MININNGTATISEELVVFPGFSFEQFFFQLPAIPLEIIL